MTAANLQPIDALEISVLMDNVTDSLSTVPKDVTNEVPRLIKNGTLKMAAGEYRCCAEHGLIPETIRDMQAFGLKGIVPAHCTGWRAVNALAATFGPSLIVPSAVGRQFTF